MTDSEKQSVAIEVQRVEITHLRELMNRSEAALALQAKEYERRLSSLNHEAEQLKAMQATYMPREVADSSFNELRARMTSVERNMWKAIGGLIAAWALFRYLVK